MNTVNKREMDKYTNVKINTVNKREMDRYTNVKINSQKEIDRWT